MPLLVHGIFLRNYYVAFAPMESSLHAPATCWLTITKCSTHAFPLPACLPALVRYRTVTLSCDVIANRIIELRRGEHKQSGKI